MERNGKLSLGQIGTNIILLILAIVTVVIGVATGSAGAMGPLAIVLIVARVAVMVIALMQIIFGGMDKMWLGMSAGIISIAAAGLGFTSITWLPAVLGVAALVLNIITAVKSKSFKKA